MSETPEKVEKSVSEAGSSLYVPPPGFPIEVYKAVQKGLKPEPARSLVFERDRQRNATFIRKGITKPGRISFDVLRRAANSVHIARICINVLKEKITKTKWSIDPIDPLKKPDEAQVKVITDLLRKPNRNSETFRSLMDKVVEDLLVLDSVSVEKVRFMDGNLAELHFVDSATIRPVFDEHGNQDVEIPLQTKAGGNEPELLPVSYVQVMDNSQYGGPESGEIVAAWPKKDFIHFHMHPQGSMEGFGYGLSPLEGVLSVVSNLLNADNYNSSYFEEGSFPPIVLHLAGQINQRDAEAFREYMHQEMSGNYHRPAVMAGGEKMEVIDLKTDSNQDMQFMEYTIYLAKLMAAAYGLSPQDIGITDEINRATAEVQKDLSEGKGYGSILSLIKQVIDEQIIADFGFDELEFNWVAPDSTEPDVASQIYDRALKNGTMTINEVRDKMGEAPLGDWADQPLLLTGEGYVPLMGVPEEDDEEVQGEKPVEEEKLSKSLTKSVLTQGGYKVWADDRGHSQPFIFMDVVSGRGMVIKPPVAVNLQSQTLEVETTNELAARGLNVRPVEKMPYVRVVEMLRAMPDVFMEFEKYVNMTSEYDSEKWKAKYGGSRKFSYYLVSQYLDGYQLNNPLLIADMSRDPAAYKAAVMDLAAMWRVEKELLLGDRRADQYFITSHWLNDSRYRAFAFDYQFKGDKERYDKTKDSIQKALANAPECLALFEKEIARPIKKGFRILG